MVWIACCLIWRLKRDGPKRPERGPGKSKNQPKKARRPCCCSAHLQLKTTADGYRSEAWVMGLACRQDDQLRAHGRGPPVASISGMIPALKSGACRSKTKKCGVLFQRFALENGPVFLMPHLDFGLRKLRILSPSARRRVHRKRLERASARWGLQGLLLRRTPWFVRVLPRRSTRSARSGTLCVFLRAAGLPWRPR